MKSGLTVACNAVLAGEWDYEKNDGLAPDMVALHSGKNVWWRCRLGHSWQATPANREHGTGCPYCVNKKVLAGFNDMASQSPDLAVQWDYEKNGSLRPHMITSCSGRKVWWICDKGHSYQATPGNRSNGTGCPYCAGRKVLPGFNDLQSRNPVLAGQWDYRKNGDLRPDMFTQFSKQKVWWLCDKGHSWQTSILDRDRNGCPVCSGRKAAAGINDLLTLYPGLGSEWDYDKNPGLRPEEFRPGSNTPVWWKCSLGHSWKVSPNHRSRGSGCPYCAGKKVLEGFNDLKTLMPDVAKEWDYEKNGSLTPENVAMYSHKQVWWRCERDHSWKNYISNRTLHKHGCPYCTGQWAIKGENDLLTLNPELAAEWDYDRNGSLKPEDVMPGSGKKVWWICEKGHSWMAVIYSRKNNGCPVCAGRQALPGVNDLKTTMPEIAKEWDYEKNGNLRPEDVTAQSNRFVWWRCKNGHSWKAQVCCRYNSNGCPKCDGRIKMRTYFI